MGILRNKVNCDLCGETFNFYKAGLSYKPVDGYICPYCRNYGENYGLMLTRKKALNTSLFSHSDRYKILNNKKLTIGEFRDFNALCQESRALMEDFKVDAKSTGRLATISADRRRGLFYVTNPDYCSVNGVKTSLVYRIDQIASYHEQYQYAEVFVNDNCEITREIITDGCIILELRDSPVEFISMHPDGVLQGGNNGVSTWAISTHNRDTLRFLYLLTGKAEGPTSHLV